MSRKSSGPQICKPDIMIRSPLKRHVARRITICPQFWRNIVQSTEQVLLHTLVRFVGLGGLTLVSGFLAGPVPKGPTPNNVLKEPRGRKWLAPPNYWAGTKTSAWHRGHRSMERRGIRQYHRRRPASEHRRARRELWAKQRHLDC